MPWWKESLRIFLEKTSHLPLALKQQSALKPKTSNPFLQEIRQAPNHTEPLAQGLGCLVLTQTRGPTSKATSVGDFTQPNKPGVLEPPRSPALTL